MDEYDNEQIEKEGERRDSEDTPRLTLSAKLEAILFYKGEPTSYEELSNILAISLDEVEKGLQDLVTQLRGRGLVLISENEKAMLGTAPSASELITQIRKQEITGELGKAALECLTIVLYRGPIARSDIDYIRGVNSQFILRRLSVRGLIEKEADSQNTRRNLYRPSLKLLSHLGVSDLKDLPEYEKVEDEFRKMSEDSEFQAIDKDFDLTSQTSTEESDVNKTEE